MSELNTLLPFVPVEAWELAEIANEVPALPAGGQQEEQQ
jgi:hypothetical protein